MTPAQLTHLKRKALDLFAAGYTIFEISWKLSLRDRIIEGAIRRRMKRNSRKVKR